MYIRTYTHTYVYMYLSTGVQVYTNQHPFGIWGYHFPPVKSSQNEKQSIVDPQISFFV